MAIDLKKRKQEWFDENAPFGHQLGYPECCIKEFCDQPPESFTGKPTKDDIRRYKAGCIDGVFTGFIPCAMHAKQIIMGKITLQSLIQNRNSAFFPFPNHGKRQS